MFVCVRPVPTEHALFQLSMKLSLCMQSVNHHMFVLVWAFVGSLAGQSFDDIGVPVKDPRVPEIDRKLCD